MEYMINENLMDRNAEEDPMFWLKTREEEEARQGLEMMKMRVYERIEDEENGAAEGKFMDCMDELYSE